MRISFPPGQPVDATLTALAAYNTNGLITQTSADTFTGRSIAAGTGIGVTNADGISGNPTVALSHLGLQSLTDPNADRVMFWDDSAGALAMVDDTTGRTSHHYLHTPSPSTGECPAVLLSLLCADGTNGL